MPVSPLFVGAFVLLFVFCVIVGLVSHLPMSVRARTRELFIFVLVTEQHGKGGSNNSDFLVADALKNLNSSLPVTLKLIQKG